MTTSINHRRIYTVCGWGEEANFKHLFAADASNGRLTNLNNLTKHDVLILEGGSDISPTIYGKKTNPRTSGINQRRDALEIACAKRAIEVGAGIFGICRGAQLACALAGGVLVQDVLNHVGAHMVETVDGRHFITSSVHHQMMNPFVIKEPGNFEILAFTEKPLSPIYHGESRDDNIEMPMEPEVIWFPKIKAIAVQGHPEYGNRETPFVQYCEELMQKYLLDIPNVPETPSEQFIKGKTSHHGVDINAF